MPKYYYTDPLKAAWMSHKFNMQILSCIGAPLRVEGIVSLGFNEKFYIHSDCYNMLTAQIGDIITDSNNKTFGEMVCRDTIAVPERHNGKNFYVLNDAIKIIQRNGIAFFEPEVEE